MSDGVGFVRKPAPQDGAIVDLPSEDLFLSLDEIMVAVRELTGEGEETPVKPARPAQKRRR